LFGIEFFQPFPNFIILIVISNNGREQSNCGREERKNTITKMVAAILAKKGTLSFAAFTKTFRKRF